MTSELKRPATYADIRLVMGEQGSGKTETIVALAVGDYYTHLDSIVSPSGQVFKAKSVDKSVNPEDYATLRKCGVFPNKLKYVRVYSEDGQSKLITIPKGFRVLSPVKIFANMTLYGVRFARIDIEFVIKYMDTEMFNDAWILSDESAMTNSRNSMSQVGKLMAQLGTTIRKRGAHFCQSAQLSKMVDWYYRAFATTSILCSYDEDTEYITLDIKKRGEKPVTTDYYAPLYRKFFKTGELIAQPQHVIDRALDKFGDGSLAKTVAKLKAENAELKRELGYAEDANSTLRKATLVGG